MHTQCSCGHKLSKHIFDAELEAYMSCMICDCEGFDIGEHTDAEELEF